MQLFVRTLNRTIAVEVTRSGTGSSLDAVKAQVEAREGAQRQPVPHRPAQPQRAAAHGASAARLARMTA